MNTAGGQISVLIVEDSPALALLLCHIIETEPRLSVIQTLSSGEAAITYLATNKPDVILMDIHLPGIDGFATTRKIMETHPVPIVICSGSGRPGEIANSFRAVEAGAVAIIEKPAGHDHPDFDIQCARLIETILLMSEVKVVKRWPKTGGNTEVEIAVPRIKTPGNPTLKVVAIGASTGGPAVLQTLISGLAPTYPAPLLIVQHITAGFLPGLVEWLSETTGFNCRIAANGEKLVPSRAYFAPDQLHLGVDSDHRIVLTDTPPENGLKPSISHLFRSVSKVYGAAAAGVLLTGMGKDGAAELKQLKDGGATTLVQDKDSSIIFGMPGEAIRLDAATACLSPANIAAYLRSIVPPGS